MVQFTVPTEATVEQRADGSLLLANKLAIATYPANMAVWLRENAARFPNKTFLGKQAGSDS